MSERTIPKSSLYQRLIAAGVEVSHHESDLYARHTPEAMAIVLAYEAFGGITNHKVFRADDGSGFWIDLPFAYDPWWEKHGF